MSIKAWTGLVLGWVGGEEVEDEGILDDFADCFSVGLGDREVEDGMYWLA